MEINITALDYFRELELMENQYGQEEDLYPWIYMLLQMAEYKKSKGENYHSISIRDVHNWKKKGAPKDMIESCKKTILNKISSNLGGPPEFLILDTNKNSKQPDFLGAIEMKIFKDSGTLELKQGQYNIIDGIHRSVCKVTYKFNIPKEEFIDKKDELIEILTDEFKKFDPKVLDYKVNFHFSNKNVHHYQLIIEKAHKINKQMIEEFFLTQNCELDNIYGKIKIEYLEIHCIEENQVLDHLKRFHKLLYTNGLEFYYLKLVDDKIEVELLADFTCDFNSFLNRDKKLLNKLEYDHNTRNEDPPQYEEWKKLIDNLIKIKWEKK